MMGSEYSLWDPFSGVTDAMVSLVSLIKLTVVVLILVGVGLLMLAGKLPMVPKPWSLVLGFAFIGVAVWLVMQGGF